MKKFVGIMIVFAVLMLTMDVFAIQPLEFFRNRTGDQTYALKAVTVNNYVLIAGTNKAVTVPTGANYAIFAANADIWVKVGGIATVPSEDVTDGSGSELNPVIRKVESGGTIGVISEYAAKVSITFYK
jgi:hypothetical protein